MGIAKVTRNYQVTIPKDVRMVKDITIGDTVLFAIEGDRVDFMKMQREESLKSVIGIWKEKETGTEYVKRIRKEWQKRAQRMGL